MAQKLLIQKWTTILDYIKHTSKDDKVDLPHPLVPHKSIVTDSFLSLILIGTYGKAKRKCYQFLSSCFGSGCDKLLMVKYINSVTTDNFHLNKACQTCMEIDVMDMCIKWTDICYRLNSCGLRNTVISKFILPASEEQVCFLVGSNILVQREGIAYNTYKLLS
jgi:hypothetical protein